MFLDVLMHGSSLMNVCWEVVNTIEGDPLPSPAPLQNTQQALQVRVALWVTVGTEYPKARDNINNSQTKFRGKGV